MAPYNLSILSIPAYYILSLFPHAYAVHLATQGKLDTWDNRNPRSTTMKAKLKDKLSADAYAKYERLEACHGNGMENFPLFVAAVVLGNMARLPQRELTTFAASFLAVRVAYTAVYTAHTTQGPTRLRGLLWFAGVGLCLRVIGRAAAVMG